MNAERFHIIVERDVGLFSLIQQVVSQIPWALREGRIPVVRFGNRCAYWTPQGHRGSDTVWEYYFEPVIADYPVAALPDHMVAELDRDIVRSFVKNMGGGSVASRNFGDHPELSGRTLRITYGQLDPRRSLRLRAAPLVERYVRPRDYLRQAVARFVDAQLEDLYIGVHARGTDALHDPYRKGSLVIDRLMRAVDRVRLPDQKIYVATDEQAVIDGFRSVYGDAIIALDTVRHVKGDARGAGPLGNLMPAYIAGDPATAARNGEEAVMEWMILCGAQHLVHNGASLARTVLLAHPEMPHTNVHLRSLPAGRRFLVHLQEDVGAFLMHRTPAGKSIYRLRKKLEKAG